MNFKQQTFITEYLRHNSAYTAYCLAYHPKEAGNYDSIMSAANRLLNDPKVGGVIDSILSGIRHDVEQEIRAKLRTDLLTIQRKREILAKIATGFALKLQQIATKMLQRPMVRSLMPPHQTVNHFQDGTQGKK